MPRERNRTGRRAATTGTPVPSATPSRPPAEPVVSGDAPEEPIVVTRGDLDVPDVQDDLGESRGTLLDGGADVAGAFPDETAGDAPEASASTGNEGGSSRASGLRGSHRQRARRNRLILSAVGAMLSMLIVFLPIAYIAYIMSSFAIGSSTVTQTSSADRATSGIRTSIDYEGLAEIAAAVEEGGGPSASSDKWADNMVYIQWGSRPNACWPIQGGSMSPKVECGSVVLVMATILLTGDYTITPDNMLLAMEAWRGSPIVPNTGWSDFLGYMEDTYGIHNKNVKHIGTEQAKEILAQGHVIAVGQGCEDRTGTPFCKEIGTPPRCCHGHVILIYKYADGYFWVKDSAPGDGAAMCAYPDGPLTVKHQGAANGRCAHNGETVSYPNYAEDFLMRGFSTEIWSDNPAKGPVVKPTPIPDFPEKKDKKGSVATAIPAKVAEVAGTFLGTGDGEQVTGLPASV